MKTLVSAALVSLSLASPALAVAQLDYSKIVGGLAMTSKYVTSCPDGKEYKSVLMHTMVTASQFFKKPVEDVAKDAVASRQPLDTIFDSADADKQVEICDALHMKLIETLGQ